VSLGEVTPRSDELTSLLVADGQDDAPHAGLVA